MNWPIETPVFDGREVALPGGVRLELTWVTDCYSDSRVGLPRASLRTGCAAAQARRGVSPRGYHALMNSSESRKLIWPLNRAVTTASARSSRPTRCSAFNRFAEKRPLPRTAFATHAQVAKSDETHYNLEKRFGPMRHDSSSTQPHLPDGRRLPHHLGSRTPGTRRGVAPALTDLVIRPCHGKTWEAAQFRLSAALDRAVARSLPEIRGTGQDRAYPRGPRG